LGGENKDFTIDDLDIKITIGYKEITVPIYADAFESLFAFLNESVEECIEIGATKGETK
jgi:hypothetical protein